QRLKDVARRSNKAGSSWGNNRSSSQFMLRHNGAWWKDRFEHQNVKPSAGDSNAKNFPAAIIGCCIISPDQGRAKLLCALSDVFSNQDYGIELLALGFVDGHDVYALRVIPISEQLILHQCVIEPLTSGGVRTRRHPHLRQGRADSLSTIERD